MKAFLFLLLMGAYGLAQTQSRTSPDCVLPFVLTTSTPSATLANSVQIASGQSTGGCSIWEVTADAFNSGAGTLTFQVATTSNTAGTAAGSFVTFPGTVVSGATSSSSFPWTFVGGPNYYPWLRVNATVSAGTIRGSIQGWRVPGAAGSSGGGGGVTNAPVCTNTSSTLKSLPISLTAVSGLNQIVAASGSTVITICSVSILANSITNIGLSSGTGANCGTGTASVSGLYQNAFGFALDALNLALPASNALCINSSASITAGGLITYVQQ